MFFASLNTFAGPIEDLVEATGEIILSKPQDVGVETMDKLYNAVQAIKATATPSEDIKSPNFNAAFNNVLRAISSRPVFSSQNQKYNSKERELINDIFDILPHLIARFAICNGEFIYQFSPAITSARSTGSYGKVLWAVLKGTISIKDLQSIPEDIQSYKFSVALWPESFTKAFESDSSTLVLRSKIRNALPRVTAYLRDKYPNSFIWDRAFYPFSDLAAMNEKFHDMMQPLLNDPSFAETLKHFAPFFQRLFDTCNRQKQATADLEINLESLKKRAPAPAAIAAAASTAATSQTTEEEDDDKNAKAEDDLNEQLAKKDGRIKELEKQLQDLKDQNQTLTQDTTDLQKLRTDNQSLTEKLDTENTEKGKLVAQVADLQKSFNEEKIKSNDLQTQLDAKGKELSTVQAALDASKKDLADAQEEATELQGKFKAVNTQKDDLQKQVGKLQKSFTEEKARGDKLKKQLEAKDKELTEAKAALDASEKDLAAAQEANEALVTLAKGFRSQITERTDLIGQQSAVIQEQETVIKDKQKEIDQLRLTQSACL